MAHTFPFLDADLVATCLALHRNTREEENLPRTTFTRMFEHMLPGQDLRIGANGCPNRSVTRWIFESLDTEPEELLEEFFRQTDLFDRKTVREIFKSGDPGQKWLVYNFIQWWRGWFGV